MVATTARPAAVASRLCWRREIEMAAMNKPLAPLNTEPSPEWGPAMRALSPRWQKAVIALFITNGDRTKAAELAGFKADNRPSLRVMAHRLFTDDRVRAAIREDVNKQIDIAEPEMLGTTLGILRNVGEKTSDRLAAIKMVWDRANPVAHKHKLEVQHTVTNDERDVQHYRALERIGAPQDAFIARFGPNGLARVEAMILAEEAKRREIESGTTIDGDYEVADDGR